MKESKACIIWPKNSYNVFALILWDERCKLRPNMYGFYIVLDDTFHLTQDRVLLC